MPSRVTPWLRILRLPNLLTVPGDAVAGFVLATRGRAAWPPELAASVGAGLCLYGAGLLFNDLADLEEDRLRRPERPLPAGRLSVPIVRRAAAGLMGGGVLLGALAGPGPFLVAALLGAAILVYDRRLERGSAAGAATLGACRALNLLLGAATAGGWPIEPVACLGALVLGGYVWAVSLVAAREAESGAVGRRRWGPAAVCLAGFLAVNRLGGLHHDLSGLVCFTWSWSLAVLASLDSGVRLGRPGADRPRGVGLLISGLLFIQAGFVMAYGHLRAGAVILVLWPVFRLFSRRFSAS